MFTTSCHVILIIIDEFYGISNKEFELKRQIIKPFFFQSQLLKYKILLIWWQNGLVTYIFKCKVNEFTRFIKY